jgi:hypothetical protein
LSSKNCKQHVFYNLIILRRFFKLANFKIIRITIIK